MRRRLFGLVLLLAVAGCGGSSGEESPRGITLANLNFVHGIFCAPGTDSCRLPDRLQLLEEWIVGAGCPDVVTLQEIWSPSLAWLVERAGEICPFPYELVQGADRLGVDDETVLSRYPVSEVRQLRLFGAFPRNVLLTRIEHPEGSMDVFSTHLASSSDGARDPCGPDCPGACVAAGARTLRECQAVQMADWIDEVHEGPNPALVAGDFNARPSSFEIDQFVSRGWVDAYIAAGNPECDPVTGIGCTSGRSDEELELPALNVRARIDFVFVVPAEEGASCAGGVEPAGDPDGDGTGTGLFAGEPNPFAESCGPAPEPMCWPSDHSGVQVDLACS